MLMVHPENDVFYWSANNATSELGFIVQKEENIIPIEVKAEENLQAKSLKVFCNKYEVGYGVRISMSDYREQDWMINVPLYNINRIYDIK